MKQNSIIIIAGPGGVGKTTTSNYLCTHFNGRFRETVSCTTRAKRPGEIDGVHYYFVNEQEFQRRVDQGEFIEHCTTAAGIMYGTLYSEIEKTLKKQNCIMIIDPGSAVKFKNNAFFKKNKTYIVYFMADEGTLKRRLEGRGSSEKEIEEKIALDRIERSYAKYFDKIIKADSVENQAREICRLIGEQY